MSCRREKKKRDEKKITLKYTINLQDTVELKDTVDLMLSDDYRTRFLAEYWQLKIRSKKLSKFIEKVKTENIAIEGSLSLREIQLKLMEALLLVLKERAEVEHL